MAMTPVSAGKERDARQHEPAASDAGKERRADRKRPCQDDADNMERRRREHEAHGISEAAGILGQLGAMGEAVEDREDATGERS